MIVLDNLEQELTNELFDDIQTRIKEISYTELVNISNICNNLLYRLFSIEQSVKNIRKSLMFRTCKCGIFFVLSLQSL